MKKIFTYIIICIVCFSFTTFFGIDDVVNAVRAGNAAQVAKSFDASVEITILDNSNNYSKSQAEVVLKDFFANNSVKNFEIVHKGENAGAQYRIGNLITKNGTYRTTIFMKNKGDIQVLQEIKFEK